MMRDELQDYIDTYDAAGMVNEPVIAALRAVIELHNPNHPWSIPSHQKCAHCSGIDFIEYPCQTIQAIAKELK